MPYAAHIVRAEPSLSYAPTALLGVHVGDIIAVRAGAKMLDPNALPIIADVPENDDRVERSVLELPGKSMGARSSD